MVSSDRLSPLGEETAEDTIWCCLSIFCCHKLFHSESWVSTILRLAHVSRGIWSCQHFLPFLFSEHVLAHWPTVSISQYGRTQATAVPDCIPMSLLVRVGCEEKFSWCICSGFGLCMWCKHTWAVADPELAACWPPPHELAQHGSWKKLGHHGPPPPQVGGAVWVLPGVLTYICHELWRKLKLLLRLLADSFLLCKDI